MTAAMLKTVRDRVVPTLRNSTWAYREVLEQMVTGGERWLDLGCGHQLLPSWMPDAGESERRLVARSSLLVGIDADFPALAKHATVKHRLHGDIACLPFRDGSFDLVTANMVVEHVEAPRALISEVRRVLRPGGRFILHTPNRNFWLIRLSLLVPGPLRRRAASFLERRPLDDVYPTRYRLNTRSALERVGRQSGFEVEQCLMLNSGLSFKRIPVAAIAELFVKRVLETEPMAWARSNLVAVLRADSPTEHRDAA